MPRPASRLPLHPLAALVVVPLAVTLLALLTAPTPALAECQPHLPTVDNPANASATNATDLSSPTSPSTAGRTAPSFTSTSTTRLSVPTAARLLNGLEPHEVDYDNIVTIAFDETPTRRRYLCAGSLIAPQWVLTAAQCEIIDFRQRPFVIHHVRDSLRGTLYYIQSFRKHFNYAAESSTLNRHDIMLVQLERPIADTVPKVSPSPALDSPSSPAPAPIPSSVPGAASPQQPADQAGQDSNPTPSPSALTSPPSPSAQPVTFNFMRLNTNTAFAVQPAKPRYLRLKGFGLKEWPHNPDIPLTGRTRELTFGDLQTTQCDDGSGSDSGRRLCTSLDTSCGPCFGDVGSPLYDVDASGRVGVLVAILTFGRADAHNPEQPLCVTTLEKPVQYIAVATYIDWIREEVGEETPLLLYNVPPEGISNTNLAPDHDPFPVAARLSLIVVSSLILLIAITALVVTCALRTMRNRRRRWRQGLRAEASFVQGKEQDDDIVDPFEGILNDQGRAPRASFTLFSRAPFRGATEFSARSLGALKAMLKKVELETEYGEFEEREPMEHVPVWVDAAWDKLFHPPSKQEMDLLHRIPTQRVVDDVLTGTDGNLEPSLQDVAYQSEREERNLELAWQKLEIKTSLRNIAEAADFASQTMEAGCESGNPSGYDSMNPSTPVSKSIQGSANMLSSVQSTPGSPPPVMRKRPVSRSTSRGGSRTGSRKTSQLTSLRNDSGTIGMHSPTAPGTPSISTPDSMRSGRAAGRVTPATQTRNEILMSAFASIDAESEQVAEETVVDANVLRALAMSKRSPVLANLRRKLGGGPSPRSTTGGSAINVAREDRAADGDMIGVATPRSGVYGRLSRSVSRSPRRGVSPTASIRVGSGRQSVSSSGRSIVASRSGGGLSTAESLTSGQSSLHVDFFTTGYDELSSSASSSASSSDAEQEDGETGNGSPIPSTTVDVDRPRAVLSVGDLLRASPSQPGRVRRARSSRKARTDAESVVSFEKEFGGRRYDEDRGIENSSQFASSRMPVSTWGRLKHVRSFESLNDRWSSGATDGADTAKGDAPETRQNDEAGYSGWHSQLGKVTTGSSSTQVVAEGMTERIPNAESAEQDVSTFTAARAHVADAEAVGASAKEADAGNVETSRSMHSSTEGKARDIAQRDMDHSPSKRTDDADILAPEEQASGVSDPNLPGGREGSDMSVASLKKMWSDWAERQRAR